MAKTIQVLMYNLAKGVTDEQYADYVIGEKGPLLESFPSAKKFTSIKVVGSPIEKIPYKWIGIYEVQSTEYWNKVDVKSKKFADFLEKWQKKVDPNYIYVIGEQIY
jgi:hypothetical protein